MKCSEEELIQMLKELHDYYWRCARKYQMSDSKSPGHAYKTGKADGGAEAIDSILLQVIGGKKMYKVLEGDWNKSAEDDLK